MSHINSGASLRQAPAARRASGELFDGAIAALCLVFVLEVLFFAPLNEAPAFALRQAQAQWDGAVPCRDIYCEYTPLAPAVFALVRGAVVPSLLLAQAAILLCAVLTRRLALNLGFTRGQARRVGVVSWALLIANEGRGIEFEPWALACVLLGTVTLTKSWSDRSAFWAGAWIGMGFWAKQYALFGWVGLLAASLWLGMRRTALWLSAGLAVGVLSPVLGLLSVGTETKSLQTLVNTAAYPAFPAWKNLMIAPELFGTMVLTLGTLTVADFGPGPRRQPLLPLALAIAAMLPFHFRGYRHYWQLAIPFLVLILFRPPLAKETSRARASRRGAITLLVLSVGLDVGRCIRDIATNAREKQTSAARQMASLAQGAKRPLYLVAPALLPWIEAPILAMKEVGPKYTRFSGSEAAAVLADADLVVWDPSVAGTDELLRRLSRDPESALPDRGFTLLRTVGPVRVYGRVPGR